MAGKRKPCPACSGTGNCSVCDGHGSKRNLLYGVATLGLGLLTRTDDCKKCNKSGKCVRCHGKGNVPDDRAR